jgi:hypothetical protein
MDFGRTISLRGGQITSVRNSIASSGRLDPQPCVLLSLHCAAVAKITCEAVQARVASTHELAITGCLVAVSRSLVAVSRGLVGVGARLIGIRKCPITIGKRLITIELVRDVLRLSPGGSVPGIPSVVSC